MLIWIIYNTAIADRPVGITFPMGQTKENNVILSVRGYALRLRMCWESSFLKLLLITFLMFVRLK